MELDKYDPNLVGVAELCEMFGLSRATVYNYIYSNNPMIPRPIIGGNRKRGEKIFWDRRHIDLHLERMKGVKVKVACNLVRGGWVPMVASKGQYWVGNPWPTVDEAMKDAVRQFHLIDEKTKKKP